MSKKINEKQLGEIAAAVEKRVKLHHGLYSLPLIGEQWEETLVNALEECGIKSHWDSGSHKVGEDIGTKEFGRISCKSGKLKTRKQGDRAGVETVSISGSRTTKYKTLKDKISHLSGNHDDFYFILSKYTEDLNSNDYRYWMAVFPSKLIKPNKFKWKKKGKNYVAEGRGITQSINSSMSGQLWTNIETHKIPYWFEIDGN